MRGFVGPLGDDIPSIFPIVAAVLLFIGTIFYANSMVDQKNKELGLRQAVLGLSYLLTEKGLLVNRTEFKEILCEDQLKKFAISRRISFLVTVKKFCKKIEFYSPDSTTTPKYFSPYFLEEFNDDSWESSQGHTFAYCTNQQITKQDFPVPEHAVVLTYPVAVRCEVNKMPTKGLGLIFVAGWK